MIFTLVFYEKDGAAHCETRLSNRFLLLATVFYGLFVWFGDYDATFIVAQYPIAFAYNDWTFLFGLVQSYVLAYIFGWIFAKFYNSV